MSPVRAWLVVVVLMVGCTNDVLSGSCRDRDGDGYGDGPDCTGEDCDDDDPLRNPGQPEVCDADDIDEDCDGSADSLDTDAIGATYFRDTDGDGFGDVDDAGTLYCDPPLGAVTDHTDCDDAQSAVHPNAVEVCDPADVDEDCANAADNDDASAIGRTRYYEDTDHDGFGSATFDDLCDPSGDFDTTVTGDCNDVGALGVNPDALERCDAADTDEDCKNGADDADPSATGKVDVFADGDGDGFGARGSTVLAQRCDAGPGEATNDDDCDDEDALHNPFASEICDAADADEDCDGGGDDADPDADAIGALTYYDDVDGDGFAGTPSVECDPEPDDALDDDDCDDTDQDVYPGAVEQCDGLQNDCDASSWTLAGENGIVSWEPPTAPAQVITGAFVTEPYTMPAGGEIWVCPGTYTVELLNTPDMPITVRSRDGTRAGAAVTVLDGQSSSSVVRLATGSTTFEGLTITHGAGFGTTTEGGGIRLFGSTFVLRESVVVANSAAHGGGIYLAGSAQLMAFNSDIGSLTAGLGNNAQQGGAVYAFSGQVVLDHTLVASNQATNAGGGLYIASGSVMAAFHDSVITKNSTAGTGGGVHVEGPALSCSSPEGLGAVTSNTAASGGGVFMSEFTTVTNDEDVPCDFGAGASDNSPSDVRLSGSFAADYSYDGAVAFECNFVSCAP